MTSRAATAMREKEIGYRLVTISLYVEDVARLEALVAALKARGARGASKSAVIRYALEHMDAATMPVPTGRKRRVRP